MKRYAFAILAILILAACGDYSKVFKSKDLSLKYKKAIELYNKKDYSRALTLFEQLNDAYKGLDSMKIVYYYTAFCNYHQGDYQYAYLFFKDYSENFPTDPRATECAYMAVFCQFKSVGDYELDQSNTVKTIGALQTFINYYPNSEYVQRCNEHIDVLREKLQKKEYEMTMQYFRQGHYRAAVTAARNTLKSFPDIVWKEELEFLTVKSQYLYAQNSIETKKLERYKEALDNWKEYNYINGSKGEHYKEALQLKEKIESEIKKINNPI